MDRLVHGIYVDNVRTFVFERCSPEVADAVERELPELRGMHVEQRKTYGLAYVTRPFAAVHIALADDQAAETMLKSCGAFIAENAATGFLKLLIKVLTPRLFARQFPEFWKRYHAFGELTVDLTWLEARRCVFTAPSYDYLGTVGAGWIDFVFNAFGYSEVKVESNAPLGAPLPETTRFSVTWR
jgi:hypothetical protein